MPDYGFNYNLGPQTKPTSLADMLNIAGAAQGLQQSMQMNPLQLQEAQQRLRQQQLLTQKAEALTPQEITTGGVKLQEEAKQAPIATAEKTAAYKKQQGALATQIATGFLSDPAIINMAKNPQEADKVFNLLNQRYKNNGVDEEAAKAHIDELKNIATNYPDKFADILKYIGTAATTSQEQATRRTPQLTVGPNGAPVLFTPAEGTVKPAVLGQTEPAPKQTYGTETTELPKIGGVSLAYPVRKAGDIRPLDPSEASDKDSQIADRQSLTKRQKALTAAEDTSEKIFKTLDKMEAETIFKGGSVAARAERLVNKFLNNEENQRLAKLLANETIANAKTLGVADSSGNVSVAGLNMQAVASGNTENVTPDVLREVARFNQANRMNIDLQAKAKEAFSKQYGDANGRTFDQIWRNNSNNTLFEALAIDKSKMPYKEKQAAYKKLFEGLSPEDLADFKNKKANIDAMVNGNFTGVK
jgi:hypothetical protein